ncbi:MAG: AarF/ABC1/UbiB kinase family protein [Oscillospiraceae bacterium]
MRPMPFDEVKKVVEDEYGEALSAVFAAFDPEPLGAASIAQAHAARLQNGRRVVVKVQRPGVYATMEQDIALLHKAAGLLGFTALGEVVDLNMVLDEMWSVAQQEMDFLTEAQNADAFRQFNREVAYVDCPLIEHAHTTERVLVMEYIDGIAIDDTYTLASEEYDLDEIGLKLADNYVKQIIEDGFFHADPHPGNLQIRDGKIVWIDLGMMGRLSPRDKTLLRDGVKAIVRGDVTRLKPLCSRWASAQSASTMSSSIPISTTF